MNTKDLRIKIIYQLGGLDMKFNLPDLKFEHKALEPHIDGQTMEIHHGKHHAGYVNKLNAALEGQDKYNQWTIEELLMKLNELPESIQTAVRNNGGGHYNHTLFWEVLVPGGNKPSDEFLKHLEDAFGSFPAFKEAFKKAALSQFGSGWAWLVLNNGKLEIQSTPNQDNPITKGSKVLLGIDVWEHAYYLNYQNKRDAYIDAFFNIIDWSVVEKRFKD
jgi:Fe-Mn family superoxide dismutase